MASISTAKNGTRRIQWVDGEGIRKGVRLGKVTKKNAEAVKFRVEQLLGAKLTGDAIAPDCAAWLKDREPALLDKLAKAGLIPEREPVEALTLGAHLESYFAKRTDVKLGTLINWRHTRRCLSEFFGAARALDSITAGDAKDFERWLKSSESRENRYAGKEADEPLALNTVRKRISNAKQFFADAVSRKLLTSNPFEGLKGTVGSNRERDFFIDRESADKILAACPDGQWKLIFALSRYGGLRCPSEHLALRWDDINWEESRMLVHAPKTEHHEGKGTRLVPIFPELRKYLDDAYHALPEGTEGSAFVITRYRDSTQNLRTTFTKIIKRAGLKPWPKLFANLRASRATELAKEFPAHVAAAWLGHSTLVANKHYWQVTDDDFAKATESGAPEGVVQNAVQSAPAVNRTRSQEVNKLSRNPEKPLKSTVRQWAAQDSNL